MKAAPSEVTQPTPTNPGESLRQAREVKGWSVAEVATQLNLTPQRLAQIEAGAFDKLPGTTFARGYIRAYAKLLEMDQNRLVMEFDQFTGTDATGSSVQAQALPSLRDWTRWVTVPVRVIAAANPYAPRARIVALVAPHPTHDLAARAPGARILMQAIEQYIDPLPAWRSQLPPGFYLAGRPLDLRELLEQARAAGAAIHAHAWGVEAAGA